MRIPRIYLANLKKNDQLIHLTDETNHYLVHVLRLKTNHPVILFNGIEAFECQGVIQTISKKKTTIEIQKVTPHHTMPRVHIHLLQAISKGSRFDYAIQKATELGIGSITPLITERSEMKLSSERFDKKMTHWQKIVNASSEQSNRVIIPIVKQPIELQKFKKPADALAFILSPNAKNKLKDYASENPQSIFIIIGPEGGLTDDEIAFLEKQNIHAISLGSRILRTETAPVAIISLINYLWGDF